MDTGPDRTTAEGSAPIEPRGPEARHEQALSYADGNGRPRSLQHGARPHARQNSRESLLLVNEALQVLSDDLDDQLDALSGINGALQRLPEAKQDVGHLEALQQIAAAQSEQIKRLTAELILSEQAERQRIAQVLHDDLQQLLIALRMRVSLVDARLPGGYTSDLAEAHALIVRALDVTQTLTAELSPPVLTGEDVTVTLDWLVLRMAQLHGLNVQVAAPRPIRVPTHLHVLLYHIVRELLFNVVKHAGVDRAHVKLVRERDQLVLIVEDEGAGFDSAAAPSQVSAGRGGFGLNSVRQRLALLGGSLEADAMPGRGTRMTLLLPLARESAEARHAAEHRADQPGA